jgi:hypothetical protein
MCSIAMHHDHRCDHELHSSKTRRERERHRHRQRGRKRKTETHEDKQIKIDRCGEWGDSHLCPDRRDRSVDYDAFDGFDSGSFYPLSSTNPSTHQQISKTSEGGVVVVCVCKCGGILPSWRWCPLLPRSRRGSSRF